MNHNHCCYECRCWCDCRCCCDCRCGCDHLEPESATLVQDVSATVVMAPQTYENRCDYLYCYQVCFTGATGAEVLLISNGTTVYPVWDRNGEPVKIGRLCECETYELRFCSVAPAHFTVENCLKCLRLKTPEPTAAVEGA